MPSTEPRKHTDTAAFNMLAHPNTSNNRTNGPKDRDSSSVSFRMIPTSEAQKPYDIIGQYAYHRIRATYFHMPTTEPR